jgi:hypothetical protein
MDGQAWNLIRMMVQIQENINHKICHMYKSFLTIFSKTDDEFFTFVDFNGNEAILYSDDGKIYVPKCLDIQEIDILDNTKNCFKDFAVTFQYKNKTMSGFLTKEGIIKTTSKLVGCTNLKQTLFLRNSNRVMEKDQNRVSIKEAYDYIKLDFNLQHENVSRMNFEHDIDVMTGVDILGKTLQIVAHSEDEVLLHTQVDSYHETKTDFENLRELLARNVESGWSRLTHNSLIYICGMLLVIIIISSCIAGRRK